MVKKKGRYWIFAFNNTPTGGLNDYKFSFDTITQFDDIIDNYSGNYESFQLLDTATNYHFQSSIVDLVRWISKNIEEVE